MSLLGLSADALLDRLAASDPTPGGGSAAAAARTSEQRSAVSSGTAVARASAAAMTGLRAAFSSSVAFGSR